MAPTLRAARMLNLLMNNPRRYLHPTLGSLRYAAGLSAAAGFPFSERGPRNLKRKRKTFDHSRRRAVSTGRIHGGGRAAGGSSPGAAARAVAPRMAATRRGAVLCEAGDPGAALHVLGRVLAGGQAAAD